MAKYTVAGVGIDCFRCGGKTQIREHQTITDKQLRQPFYYSQWYHCPNRACKTQNIMPKEFIVWNKNQKAREMTATQKLLLEDHQNRMRLFRVANGI